MRVSLNHNQYPSYYTGRLADTEREIIVAFSTDSSSSSNKNDVITYQPTKRTAVSLLV